MEIKRKSHFKNIPEAKEWFEDWVSALEELNDKRYTRIPIKTSLGNTHVWGLNVDKHDWDTIVIFPGARTSVLFWDFDNGLRALEERFKIFLVETNGLPNLSDGNTPDIKSNGYGEWASEVFERLNISKAFIAGASFGALICMKLCVVNPLKVEAAFLLNPGCLQPFSLSIKNLYYNILPILFPNRKNVTTFLDKAILCKPYHILSESSENLLIDYELYALTCYQDNTQKPYYMSDELKKVSSDVYLIVGDKDLLFPYQKSIKNAESKLALLKETIVLSNVGHGIETHRDAIDIIGNRIKNYRQYQSV